MTQISLFRFFAVTVAANGDEFSGGIFYDAGKYLAKHIVGLLPKVDQVRNK